MSITERITTVLEFDINKCICGKIPDINKYNAGGNDISIVVKCDCGLRYGEICTYLGYGITLKEFAQSVVDKWNVMIKENKNATKSR